MTRGKAKQWLSTQAASAVLGLSPEQLRSLRRRGILKPGQHFKYKNPQAERPEYLWCIAAIDAFLSDV